VRARTVLSLVLIALLIGLTPVAYAAPPDPSWSPGYWDDDDFDNSVTFIVGAAAIDAVAPADAGPLVVHVTHLEADTPSRNAVPFRSARSSRAPPVASSPDC
jgi:hypothetical protein